MKNVQIWQVRVGSAYNEKGTLELVEKSTEAASYDLLSYTEVEKLANKSFLDLYIVREDTKDKLKVTLKFKKHVVWEGQSTQLVEIKYQVQKALWNS